MTPDLNTVALVHAALDHPLNATGLPDGYREHCDRLVAQCLEIRLKGGAIDIPN